MNEMQSLVSAVSTAAASGWFAAFWQGAVLAAVVALALRMVPGISAAIRSLIWLNLFLLIVLLHFLPLLARPAAGAADPAVFHIHAGWSLGIAAAWLVLSLFRAAELLSSVLQLRGLARGSSLIPTDAALDAILADAPLGRRARLCASAAVTRPSFLGFFRPRILIPAALIEKLTPEEMHQVVQHEMEHLRRFDDWTNLLQKVALVLFPLNPVLAWVERRVCAERELACDDRVMASGNQPKAYAMCLTRLAEFSMLQRGFSLMLGAWERRPELVKRVQRILSQPVESMGRRPARAAGAAVLCGAMACTLLLSRCPQFISFAPAAQPATAADAAGADLRSLSEAMGGRPELVKAIMPSPAARRDAASSLRAEMYPTRAVGGTYPARTDLVRANPAAPTRLRTAAARRLRQPASRLASLVASQRPDRTSSNFRASASLMVMTEWTGNQPERFIVFSELPSAPRVVMARQPVSYAAVATPMGWLILQI